MMRSSTIRSAPAMNRKPPACDSCKAKRVLCHPQSNGLPCPRCVEKGLVCKTTYIPRGRPRKNPTLSSGPVPSNTSVSINGDSQPFNASSPSSSKTSPGPCQSLVVVQPRLELSEASELSCDLVKHLFECFTSSPQYRHPLFRSCGLKNVLSSAAWKLDLLPLEARVLAYCVCTLSASISFDSAIIGPGPRPESFTDGSVFFPGADLQGYSIRRAPMFRALHERALSLACEARIHLEVSDYNAASCFLLDSLEESVEVKSRPWAVAYISHVRSLAGSWRNAEHSRAVWCGFLMAEALSATVRRQPILVTHTDQLLITGCEPPSLEILFQSLQAMVQTSKKPAVYMVFAEIRSFLFHFTRLCRELHEKITGDYARSQPIAEASVINFISDLSIIKSIMSLLLSPFDFHTAPKPPSNKFSEILGRPTDEDGNMRSCAFAMCVGYTGLVLALHHEMEYRAVVDMGTQSQWTLDRTALLRRQAHHLASNAVEDVLRTLQLLPSLPHIMHIDWSGILGWTQFVLSEADAAGGVSPTRIPVFERLIDVLKALGYSRDISQSHAMIERMEAHIAAYMTTNSFPADNSFSDMPFTLDTTWMGVFSVDLGNTHFT